MRILFLLLPLLALSQFKPTTKADLETAVRLWRDNNAYVLEFAHSHALLMSKCY